MALALPSAPRTIYRHVGDDKRAGGTLYTHLRHGLKKRRKQRGSKNLRGIIRNRVDIEQRPTVVETRKRLGDWEADLVCGTGASGYLVTLVERLSRRVLIGYTRTKTAGEVTSGSPQNSAANATLPNRTIAGNSD